MAIGKPRANKRSSGGGSCSSTVTTIVLVSVCALGVWILTSNSTVSPQKTANRINNDSSFDSGRHSVKRHRKVPFDAMIAPREKLVDLPINTSDSEDTHYGFPTDVVEHDDGLKAGNDPATIRETSRDDKVEKDENSGGSGLTETEAEIKPESTSDVDDDAESLNDSDVGKQEAEEHQEEAREEQEMEISTSVIEDEQHGSEEEVQKTQKIQDSEDNTDYQHSEETTENEYDQQSDTEDKQTESGGEDDIQELEDNQEQEITDEEQEKRMENQQEEEEDEEEKEATPREDDGPIESHSIAAETRAQVESREARDIRKKMEQAKISIQSTIANTTTPKKPSKTVNSTMVKKHSSGVPNESENQTQVDIKVTADVDMYGYKWELCNVSTGTDYIPCLDNEIAIRNLHHWSPYEHQERHCPKEAPMCLVPLPKGYKTPIPWPEKKTLFDGKGSQNWVKVAGEFVTFPRGGAQFMHGCGVASFGGYLFDRDVLTMSFAPKDEHEAQTQFALERGIPAVSAVMGTQRLPFPSRVFDLVHCVRCKVPWHKEGGYFVWSAPPVYRTLEEDVQIWKEMSALTVAMCWELVTIKKDKLNVIGVAVYRKPDLNECYNERKKQQPPICRPDDDPDAAWYVPLQACMHKMPMMDTERGSHWPEEWPERVQKPPYWLNKSQIGIYGKAAPNDFNADYEHWKSVVSKSYMSDLGINWSNIRNVMDMRAVYGGFAAALKDLKLWVLNVVNMDSPDTLPIIFERGLFGIYHDWCKIAPVVAEIDRILRPGGNLIAWDESSMIREIEKFLKSLHWEVNSTLTNNQEGIISAQKTTWRPSTYAATS
ncbi:putative S-adenosyl-L-methionine-dependent methyltransferase [Cynara cardunculus var. scolymus]|uniref:Putative S-adenosyl-L-methionine-dependent methyltransferase n=1 Tax=Cynara cardunculus var. scolymus TaxID=59895 RepID=A0A118JUC0_CYNCS|nr:putative S-adenosyl-L-methionine-dependent methyltransferase [Cynara cardunculus var. scolymus]